MKCEGIIKGLLTLDRQTRQQTDNTTSVDACVAKHFTSQPNLL